MAVLTQARDVGVLARHGGQVVLVREEYPTWGGAYWNIPSGRIEQNETPEQGGCRELAGSGSALAGGSSRGISYHP